MHAICPAAALSDRSHSDGRVAGGLGRPTAKAISAVAAPSSSALPYCFPFRRRRTISKITLPQDARGGDGNSTSTGADPWMQVSRICGHVSSNGQQVLQLYSRYRNHFVVVQQSAVSA